MKDTARAIWSVMATLALCAACSGDGGPTPGAEAGPPRDATVIDGAVVYDGGEGVGDAARLDGGPAADAGGTWCTVTECDPREADCGAALCTLTDSGSVCVDETVGLEEGATCDDTLDCAEGLACFRRGELGICGRPCCPGDDAASCGGDQRCGGTGVLVDGTVTDWWSCVGRRPCDVLAPEATCEPGEGCYIVSSEGATDCRRAGDAGVGEPCATQQDCSSGLFCGGLASSTCVRICSRGDAGATVTCPSDEGSCRAYAHSPPGTGLCTVETSTAR